MKIELRIGGEPRAIDLEWKGNRYCGRIGSRNVEAEVLEKSPGSLAVRVGSRSFDVTYAGDGRGFLFDLGEAEFWVEIPDPLRPSSGGEKGAETEGRVEVRASMPGKVVAVKVRPGEPVKQGQGLLVVEAMKMENEVPSPKSGKVIAVEVTRGQTVETGGLLATVE